MHGHPLCLANFAWFIGWLAAVAVLFRSGLDLPLQTRFSRLGTWIYTPGVILVIFAIAVFANVVLSLHDMHFDLTREKVFTPSEKALEVVDRLKQPVKLTYFYQGQDPNAKRAKDMTELMGRRNPLLTVRTVDPDKQPSLAETAGIKVYNAAVLEADGRRVIVRSTDESEIAIGIQRVIRERVINVCFIEGHNEYPIDNYEFHTHFAGLSGHDHNRATSKVVKMTAHGLGRMRRALVGIGYDVRKIVPASEGSIPPDCAVAIDANPRTTYLPAESAALEDYLRQGGSLLLMYDLGFVLEPGLERLMQTLGVRFPQAVVLDPKMHYATDPEMVAVTAYDQHPITRNVSFTFYPGVRPLELIPPSQGIQIAPLITSSSNSYTKSVAAVAQRQLTSEANRDESTSPETPQSYVLAAMAEGTLAGGRPFRVIVIGDGDFASNSFFPYMANSDLAISMTRWLVREEHAASIASRIPVPSLILLTGTQMQRIFLVVGVLLPFSVILLGALVWWRRR